MDAKEGTTLAQTAVAILLVLMVIGVVTGLAIYGYNKVNAGTQQLEVKTAGIEETQYKAVNENILTGSALKTQIQQDYNSDVVILVSAYGDRTAMGTAGSNYNNFGLQQDGTQCPAGTVKSCSITLDTSGRFSIAASATVGTAIKEGYRNTAIALMNDKANTASPLATYVPDTVKYYCRLLYDENGSRIGYVATAIE